jgi:hypothetical protein
MSSLSRLLSHQLPVNYCKLIFQSKHLISPALRSWNNLLRRVGLDRNPTRRIIVSSVSLEAATLNPITNWIFNGSVKILPHITSSWDDYSQVQKQFISRLISFNCQSASSTCTSSLPQSADVLLPTNRFYCPPASRRTKETNAQEGERVHVIII